MKTHYDPCAKLDVETQDMPYREDPVRTLMARIYQPRGDGPFPVLLRVLDRGEVLSLPPLLILQGGEDTNVPPAVQQRFADSYQNAGGHVTLEVFAGCEHQWVRNPGPDTDRAIQTIKEFIAQQVNS